MSDSEKPSVISKYKDTAPLGLGTGAASALVKEAKKIVIDLVIDNSPGNSREKKSLKSYLVKLAESPIGDILLSAALAELLGQISILSKVLSEEKIELLQTCFRMNASMKVGEVATTLLLSGGEELINQLKGKVKTLSKTADTLASVIPETVKA